MSTSVVRVVFMRFNVAMSPIRTDETCVYNSRGKQKHPLGSTRSSDPFVCLFWRRIEVLTVFWRYRTPSLGLQQIQSPRSSRKVCYNNTILVPLFDVLWALLGRLTTNVFNTVFLFFIVSHGWLRFGGGRDRDHDRCVKLIMMRFDFSLRTNVP